MTRFSVVIALHNQRERVLEAIESVKRQTLPAYEVVVVDDGSSDGSADAVRARFDDVILIAQENLGKGVARNYGAYLSSGDWICFLDHDDLWHPEKLQCIDGYLENRPEIIGVDHGVWIFCEEHGMTESAWGLQVDFIARTYAEAMEQIEAIGAPRNDFSYLERVGSSFEASLRHVHSTTSAMSIRRDAFFRAGGFHPSHANSEDWSLSTSVARLGEWGTIPRALSCQRFLPSSDTTDSAAPIMILSTLTNQWYSGRPLIHRTKGFEFTAELRTYGEENRVIAQTAIWHALRLRDVRGATAAVHFSMLILPAWRDRFFAFLPPGVSTRLLSCAPRTHTRSRQDARD